MAKAALTSVTSMNSAQKSSVLSPLRRIAEPDGLKPVPKTIGTEISVPVVSAKAAAVSANPTDSAQNASAGMVLPPVLPPIPAPGTDAQESEDTNAQESVAQKKIDPTQMAVPGPCSNCS